MTPIAQRAAPAAAWPGWRLGRASLAAKLSVAFLGLVALVLIVNGAVDSYLTYGQAKRAALEVETEKARGAAERVGVFLDEIQTQLGWTAGVEWGYSKLEQQRYDFIRLLRQAPAITALSYIDGKGREQLAVSRLEPDAVASGKDFSADPQFVRAVADKIWFGPVEFRRGSEPYMTVALAHVGKNPGVTVADVNLKLVWDVVSAIHVGDKGFAYVVDDKGRLIAHPDLSLVLRDTDFSHLPQVAAALAGRGASEAEVARSLDGSAVLTAHAVAPKTHWTVFVEQPLAEALATAYRSALRSLALLGLGLALAAVSGVALARRMAAPIRLLQAGAERLGAGDLAQRLDIRTGDEIEALAGGFNRMAQRLQESYENLEGKVEARTRDLNEALAQQTATADVLKVISRSAFGLKTVLQTLVDSAVRLCANDGVIYLRDGDLYRAEAAFGAEIAGADPRNRSPRRPGRDSITGRVALSGRVEQIPDNQADPEFQVAPAQRMNMRALLGVPLLRDGEVEGVFVLAKPDPGLFSERAVELVRSFADQAVIAIQNVRLFEEVRARTRDLEESLAQQTATADVLKAISRSAFDLDGVLKTLVESARELCHASIAGIYVVSGEFLRFRALAGGGPDFEAFLRANPFPVAAPTRANNTGRVLLTKAASYVEDVASEPDYAFGEAPRLGGFRSLFGVPLMREGEVIGVFQIGAPEPGALNQRQIDLVGAFADQAVIAIENARLFEEVQSRTRDLEESLAQQTATADVLKVISRSVMDLDPVLQTLIDTAVRLARGSRGTIWIKEGDFLVARAFHRNVSKELRHYLSSTRWPIDGDSHQLLAARESRVVHIPDLSKVDDIITSEIKKRAAFGAGLWVPLIGEGQTIGVFGVPRDEPVAFTDREIEIVKTFADQAVIAIQNSRLFEEVQARTREVEESLAQQTATADVLKVISRSAFDLQAVFATLIDSAVELSGAGRGSIFLRDGELYRVRAVSSGADARWMQFLQAHPLVPSRGNAMGRVALSGKIECIADITEDSEYVLPVNDYIRTRSILAVPLLRDDRVEGGLVLARVEPGRFSPRQIELVQTFADQAVIAIENARLFDEVQARTRDLEESLAQQTATADVLKVISRSAFDLDAIFQALITTAARLCDAYSGAIGLRQGDQIRYVAAHGHGADDTLPQHLMRHPMPLDRTTMSGRTILSGRVEQIPDIEDDSEFAVPMAAQGNPARALLGAPLIGKAGVEGAIALTRLTPGLYSPRQVEILQTFADQAVIAIENARLLDEVQARTRELEQSLSDLRKTQDRLVQSEKLASLGQLTAGIAHEIKNPLNFVNNFATLSRELMEELRETLQKLPDDARADADDLMGLIDSNLEKVASHGKRADSIVKNMLLHAREGSGERGRVNVNAMVEEALNLGYHGARAEKPGFNVTLERDFDSNAGEADIYLQEVTRVLLNLISNGFYASAQRKLRNEPDYAPTLKATTRDLGHSVEIRIRDNGTGIPDEVRAKMFNPFFTTKPAGEGTGLGLSLSHDIVVKQHGGSLDVETAPGAFTEFVITLPREGAGT